MSAPTRRAVLAAGASAAAAAFATAPFALAEAPMTGVQRPTRATVKLGGFEVTTLLDGAVQLDGPHPIFGENQTPETVAELLSANFLPSDRLEIGFTPVIVNTGAEVVMFDTGNGAGRRPDAGQFRARLAEAGLTPEQVDVIVLTHFHPDHIGGLMEDGAPAFPNARYVATATEFDFWSPEDKRSGPTERVALLTRDNVLPLAERMTMISDGQDVVSGITAMAAPGHTPGHTAYHIESEGRRLLITADTTNHYVASLQRPDWHVRFDMDKEAAAASRKAVLGMLAAERIPFTGYHMPFPSIGFVEEAGAGYRYVPASYQLHL